MIGNDVGVIGVSGSGVGIVIEIGIASISGGSGVVNGVGMRFEVEVGVVRITGWRVWVTTVEICIWSLREATGILF